MTVRMPANAEALAERLNGLCDGYSFHTGWSLHDVRSGQRAYRHGDVVVPSGSTRKVAILMTALSLVQRGDFALEQPCRIDPQRYAGKPVSAGGAFGGFLQPFTITLHDVLLMMIIVSDNLCTGLVLDMVGLDHVNEFCRSVGLRDTAHREAVPRDGKSVGGKANLLLETMNVTTPNDQARLFRLIVEGATDGQASLVMGVTSVLCQLALRILGQQKLAGRMPVRLPREVKVAHKTGTNEGRNYHDGGVVYQDGAPRFILTVYTEHVPQTLPDGEAGNVAASALIAQLTRACWDGLSLREEVEGGGEG